MKWAQKNYENDVNFEGGKENSLKPPKEIYYDCFKNAIKKPLLFNIIG